ncbi:MAG: sugar ABC transporter permease [Nitrososphaeria archaeon]
MKSSKLTPYFFLLPALILFCSVLLYPMIENLYLSFTNWDGKSDPKFVGLENYWYFLRDPIIYTSISNTLIWVALAIAIPVTIALGVAVMVEGKRLETLYMIMFGFGALSGVVVGLIWKLVYEPSFGMLNTLLRGVGLGSLALPWLGLPGVNTYFIIVAYTWCWMPFPMIIFVTGLKSIPVDIINAAKVDGAYGWTLFRNVTFPLLRPYTIVNIALTILNTLKVFDIIYVMTGGGPFRSSETLAVTMFFDAFSLRQYGYGAAIGTILFVIVIVVTIVYLQYSFKGEITY